MNMKITYLSILVFTIVLVLMSGLPLVASPGAMNYASAKYAPADTQTQANANECNTNTNCAVTSPQTGDGTANSPINLQISKFNEADEEPPTSLQTERLPVVAPGCRPAGTAPIILINCEITGT